MTPERVPQRTGSGVTDVPLFTDEQVPLGVAAVLSDGQLVGGVTGLDKPYGPSASRVHTLAGTLAGYRWPGRGGYDHLRKAQRQAAYRAAWDALASLAAEPD